MMRCWLLSLALLLVTSTLTQGFFQERDEKAPEPSMRALRQFMESRLAERELAVGQQDSSSASSKSGKGKGGSRSSKSSKKGSKKISKNGSKKQHYDEREFNFMIYLEENSLSTPFDTNVTLGTKFAFTGPMYTDDDASTDSSGDASTDSSGGSSIDSSGDDDYTIGTASGSCVVCLSELEWCCDFFLIFDKNGDDFYDFGMVSLIGTITGTPGTGELMVAGAGGDFVGSQKGHAAVLVDPNGSPHVYAQLKLSA